MFNQLVLDDYLTKYFCSQFKSTVELIDQWPIIKFRLTIAIGVRVE